NGDGGSSSNQTGASNVQSIASSDLAVTGTVTGLSTIGAVLTANAGTPTSTAQFSYFQPPFNNSFATSRVLQFTWGFALSAATGSYVFSYSDGVLSGNIITGSSSGGAIGATFTLPAGINLSNLTITATSNRASGTTALFTVSGIKILVS